MLKSVRKLKFAIVISVFLFSASIVLGQDLGSSTGIFRATNPKPKANTPAKKTTPKSKTTKAPANRTAAKTAAKKTPPKTTTTTAKSTKPPAKSSKNNKEVSKKTSEPIKDVIITVGKPASNDLEETYELAIEEGNIARDRRDYDLAEAAYRRAKAVKAKDYRAIYGMGNIYSDQQRWEEAEQAYREAIALAAESPDPYVAISYVLTQPVIGKDLSVRYLEAQKMARRAIELDPNNPVAHDQLGVALELSGNIDRITHDAYQRAVTLDPEFALAHAHLGRLLRRNGKVKESGEAYRRAIELATDVPTMILVADVLQSQQRYNESEQLLRQALREDQKNPTAMFLLGRALIARGAFDEAESILKKSIQVSPRSLISYTLLGSLRARQGDFKDAEDILKKALQVVTEREKKVLAKEFETVGDGFLASGKKKDAVRAYQQAIALDSEKSILNDKLAKAQED